MRDELRELKKELNRELKKLDKEIKSLKKTMGVEPVKDSQHSVIITGKEDNRQTKIIQTKLNLMRKVLNTVKERF
ncbi:hypothetical protein ABES35_08455 [Bacillus subtilis]|uniref:hypothetical protein n=1 Tax=Bacillus subtilis TaxID=1423 RepID=UPI000FFE2CE0|nr:hypothetical protein [Bacillus subtilis]MEC2400920.1 hypothetical protein [Bacillus subtilis]MED4660647.1 hypothetical protein [Bacillus subtilis]MED4666235.1 hypothetical protein [Bacillus subtilis]NCT26198.1 hypothetical protein [Bacillus subtilis subsp. subtilis]QAT56935.1 hypothetical protein EQW70_05965 [Bacillus subtilis]